MNMKWSLYMSSNQQNLTIGSIRLKSDYWVVKISLTTGLGNYPGPGNDNCMWFGGVCSCRCLPLLPELVCSIHEIWPKPFSRALGSYQVLL